MPLDQLPEEKETGATMSFFDHVDELRKYLIRSVLAILVGTILIFVFIRQLFEYVILGPTRPDFWSYRKLCELSERIKGGDDWCIHLSNTDFTNLRWEGQFMMAMKVAFIGGIILAFPFVLRQLWQFIKPALRHKEKSNSRGMVLFCSLLFFMGVLFGYFILAPISLNFFDSFSVSDKIDNNITVQSTVSFVTILTLGSGVIFQLPLLMFILAKVGFLTTKFLKKNRKYSFLVILILSALVTPPDVISQIFLSLPLYLLYELGIVLTKRVEKNRPVYE